jgi:hypothetical protein
MEPISLYIACKKHLGGQFLEWTPGARMAVLKRTTGKGMSELSQNMLEAMVTLQVTDLPWTEPPVFEKIVWALNGHVPNMFLMEKPPSYYVAYAIVIMSSLNKTNGFDDEVKRYIASVLADDGLCVASGPLTMVQPFLDRLLPDNFKSEKEAIMKVWEKRQATNLMDLEVDAADLVSAQVSKLAVIELYLRRKETILSEELK